MQIAQLLAERPDLLSYLAHHRWLEVLQKARLIPNVFHPLAPGVKILRRRFRPKAAQTFASAPVGTPQCTTKIVDRKIVQRPARESIANPLQRRFHLVPLRPEAIRVRHNFRPQRRGGLLEGSASG